MKEKIILGNKVELSYDSIGLELERLQSALKLVTWRLSKSPLETPARTIWK